MYSARVISGKGRGRRIGFPTLNLEIPNPFPHSHGIYAGYLSIGKTYYCAAIHFGPIPTFQESVPTLEAYVLGEAITHTPETVTFEFVKRLRDIREFSSVEELQTQIKHDIEETRRCCG